MAAESTSYTPTELFAGAASETRRTVTVKAGQNLAANTLVMFDAAGKVVAHSGDSTIIPAGVLIAAVNAVADSAGMIYCDGDFIGSLIVWPALIDTFAVTNLLKQKLLAGTELYATFYSAGETA